jgi:hypothetical protein
MTEKVDISDLTKRVSDLWEKAVEEELANSSEVSFDAFLGAQYSIAFLAGQCTITQDGIEIVEIALYELQQLIDDNVEDEDDEDDDDDEDEDEEDE